MAATPSPPLLEEITSEENIGDQKKWLVRCVAEALRDFEAENQEKPDWISSENNLSDSGHA
jgi:hypothetical protein